VYRVLFLLVLLQFPFNGTAQDSFTQVVWNNFYQFSRLSAKEKVERYEQLKKLCIQRNITTDSTYTNLLFLYAAAKFEINEPKTAIALLNETIKISQQHPSKNPVSYLSKYYFYLGYYEEAENYYSQALQHYNVAYEMGLKEPNKWGISSMSCHRLAHLYYQIQDYNRGLKHASVGASIARTQGDMVNLTKNLYEQCVNLKELKENETLPSKIDSLNQLANKYATSYEKALYWKLFGDIAFSKHDFVMAKDWFLKSAKLFEDQQDLASLGDLYVDLSEAFAFLKSDSTHYFYQLAIRHNQDVFNLSRLYNNRALWLRNRRKYDQALSYLKQSLITLPINFKPKNIFENPIASQLKILYKKDYVFTPLLDKAEILSLDKTNKTNLKHALNTYMLLDTLVDYIRWQHQGMATKLFWREKLNSLYEQAIETAYQLNDTEKAFYFLEKSRAVLLLDQLNSYTAKNFLPQAEAEKEAVLRMQVSHYQSIDEQNEYLSDFLQAQAKLDAYVKDLEKRYPRYYEYKYNSHVPSLAEVQDYLAKGQQSLLSYYEGKQGVYLLVVNPQKSVLKKIDSASYNSKKHELISFFAHPNQFNQQYDRYLQAANRFYQLVLTPIQAYLTSRVIVSTSGAIIPFAALSTSAQKADYLVNHHAFSYIYSARALLRRQVHSSAGEVPNYFLGIAPIDYPYKTSLAQLPGATKALAENEQLFQSTLLLTNEKANKANFETQWPQAKVVQLISHAYADQENTEPLIYFADSSLSLNNIHQEQTQTQLLVLSACRTGVGKDYQGEGVFSLSRGFMATGVPSVYSTLWDVADLDAYALSHQILQAASKQVPLDLALQQAQINWLRKADRSKQLPHAWAGMILLGSSTPLPPESANHVWLWYFLILSAALTFGIWLWKKKRVEKRL